MKDQIDKYHEQKVKVAIDPREYFGKFALPNQIIELEGHAFLTRENFLNTGNDFIFVILENGQIVAINVDKTHIELVE